MPHVAQTSLVTGGSGFIGSELVRQLLAANHRVIAYDNVSFGRWENLEPHANLVKIEADLRDAAKIGQVASRYSPASVFHLAALHFIPYCISHPSETIAVNVEGTVNLLEACRQAEVKDVVFASTAAVYDVSDNPHREEDRLQPMEIYGASKLFGEQLLELFHGQTGIRCAAARLFNGFGRRETNPHVIPEILDQLTRSDSIRLGNVKPKRDFIHTSDIAAALRCLAEARIAAFQAFNVATGIEHSVEELVGMMADILGRPIEIVTQESRKRKVERFHLSGDTSKIRDMTGWQPRITAREGLRDILEWSGLLADRPQKRSTAQQA